MTEHAPKMTAAELDRFLREVFPEAFAGGKDLRIEEVGLRHARVRGLFHPSNLRPGGTISGPTMMALADYAMYVAILASLGPVALAVTTNLNINFLRKPEPVELIADCRLLKLGKRLAVGDVSLYSDGASEMCAHVTSTYSIPSS